MAGIDQRLRDLKLTLPGAPAPGGSYVPSVRSGNLVYISGMIPLVDGELPFVGAVGDTVSLEQGQAAARQCVLNALAVIVAEYGSLDVVKRIVYVQGFIRTAGGFTDSHVVLNGASDLLAEIFGERGQHARAAVGVFSLPKNVPVEIQFVVEVSA